MNAILSSKLYLGLIATVVVLGGAGAIWIVSNTGPAATETEQRLRGVTLASVGELAQDTTPISVVGTVRSISEANLRAQVSGRIVQVGATLGRTVVAGTLLAEIENASERAAVLQAEGAVEAAEAALAQARVGIRSEQRSILEEKVRDARAALSAAHDSVVSTVRNAYEEADEAVHVDIDDLFDNPSSVSPTLTVLIPIPQVPQDLVQRRVTVEATLTAWSDLLSELTAQSDLDAFLLDAEERVAHIRDFVNLAAQGVNSLVASDAQPQATIDAHHTNVNAARAALSTVASNLATQRTSLSNKRAALEVAEQELAQGQAGQRAEEIASLEAQVKQARGSYHQALAALEKTRIRTPITGTVNVLSVQPGDFVSAQDPVATVANNGTLEIEAFITADDRLFIQPGAAALVDGQYSARVTSAGAGLDSTTRKVKVMIGLENPNVPLVHGDSVSVSIERDVRSSAATEGAPIAIPVTALKAEADRFLVFTVNSSGELESHEVRIGALLGDRVIIAEGVTGDMRIVVDARGLSAGQEVTIME